MSKLALELIEKEKRERTGKLDLGNCGLKRLPEELFKLVWLEELNLSYNYIYVSDSFCGLKKIRSINLSESSINDFTFLKNFHGLEKLILHSSYIPKDDFSFIENLKK